MDTFKTFCGKWQSTTLENFDNFMKELGKWSARRCSREYGLVIRPQDSQMKFLFVDLQLSLD